LIYVNNVLENVTYIRSFPSIAVIFSNLLACSLHNSLLTFHINFTFISTHHLQVPSHTTFYLMCSKRLSSSQLCFKRTPSISLSAVSRINYLNLYQIRNINTSPISKASTQWSREVSARHVHTQTQKQIRTDVMSN